MKQNTTAPDSSEADKEKKRLIKQKAEDHEKKIESTLISPLGDKKKPEGDKLPIDLSPSIDTSITKSTTKRSEAKKVREEIVP